jgi:hypothetical protein
MKWLRVTHSVRLAGHVECSALELLERLKELLVSVQMA